MSYQSRVADFRELGSRFPCEMPGPLMCVHTVEPTLWDRLRTNVALYMSRCLPGNRVILDEAELLHAFEAEQDNLRNVTPNGMIVPKRELTLEFNAVARTLADIFDSLNIRDLIISWHYPLNVRVKFGEADETNLTRSHPTEALHTDAWVGNPIHCVLVHLPVFGDLERNHLVFYDAPEAMDESWLQPLSSYAEGQNYAQQFTRMDFTPKCGQLILADISLVHASNRLPGAGTRISLDTRFNPTRSGDVISLDPATADQIGEYVPHRVLTGLGENYMFYFPDSIAGPIRADKGMGGPSHAQVVALPTLLSKAA